jgi:hypothetical protein
MAQDIFANTSGSDIRKRWALMQLAAASDSSPVKHPLQAVARAMQGGMGGYMSYQADQADKDAGEKMFSSLPGLGGGMPAPQAAAPAPQAGPSNFGDAIAGIESGGKYDALGPVTKTGDRAYGKYQVMGANVPQWSKAHLGTEMTPQAFLASPEAQDAVFKGQFGQYAQKYGPQGAARAWFAGEGGMNNPQAKDQLGTTVADYERKFTGALGPQMAGPGVPQMPGAAPQQMAQAPGGAPQGGPARTQMQIPPEVAETIKRLGADPRTRAQAWQMYLQFAKPADQWVQERGQDGSIYQRNALTGEMKAVEKSDVLPQAAVDQKIAIARASKPETSITVDQRGENEFAKAAGKKQADRFDAIVTGAQEAQGMVANLNTLRELGSRITTGKQAEITAALGPYAEAFGVKIDGLDDLQAYQAIVSKMAPTMRVPGSGATSDFEMAQFLKALPSLGNKPGGNEIISQTFESIAQHKIAAGEIASRAMAGEIKPNEAEKELRALPDPMTLWKQQGKKLHGGETAPAAPVAPDRGAIEQEMRRRGILK